MSFPRSSGVLLHPTSLPGRFGIGDFGQGAYNLVDFLYASDQSLWQILPLAPTGYGDSPYQSFSAFAGNILLISPERLIEEHFLSEEDISQAPQFPEDHVDYSQVIAFKSEVLDRAFHRFTSAADADIKREVRSFSEQASGWLDDYALFRALKDEHGGASWINWEPGLAKREASALARARARLLEKIEAQKFFQYLFFKQWSALKDYSHAHQVKIIGDIPIFVAYDSADVWAHPEMFKLDGNGLPRVVAGVPPDYFSKTGQLWGNPIYDWDRMRADGYRWWVERFRATFEVVDMARVDHFRGFVACWEVPADESTAENGTWVEVPGREIFSVLKKELGELPIIAEDLGVITPDVEALRDDFGFPGMRILQFAFRNVTNSDLPHNYTRNTVVYTGTHDNDTSVGWFNSKPGAGSIRDEAQIERERAFCLQYLKSDGREINWDFIRAALASVADTAILPLQDLLGLDSRARMNLPASQEGNWTWRYLPGALTSDRSDRLKSLTRLYVRGREQPKEITRD